MKYSQIFLDEVRSSGGKSGYRCAECAFGTGFYALCKKHRDRARRTWVAWAQERKNKCLCVACNGLAPIVVRATGKTQQGVYCTKHRKINAKRCLAWSRANKDYIKAKLDLLKQSGLCLHCGSRPIRTEGATQCITCHTRIKRDQKLRDRYQSGLKSNRRL